MKREPATKPWREGLPLPHCVRLRIYNEWWQRYEAAVFDLDSYFMAECVITEGWQEMTPYLLPPKAGDPSQRDLLIELLDHHERDVRPVLDLMVQARPEAGAALVTKWEAWWQEFRGQRLAPRR